MARVIFWDVDTQYDFMKADGRLYVPDAEHITTNLKKLTDYAHGHGIRIIASADDHVAGHRELSDTPNWKDTFPPHCMRGTPGQKKIPETSAPDPPRCGARGRAARLGPLLPPGAHRRPSRRAGGDGPADDRPPLVRDGAAAVGHGAPAGRARPHDASRHDRYHLRDRFHGDGGTERGSPARAFACERHVQRALRPSRASVPQG